MVVWLPIRIINEWLKKVFLVKPKVNDKSSYTESCSVIGQVVQKMKFHFWACRLLDSKMS